MLELLISKLIALLPTISSITKENHEIRKNALSSISLALTETYLYYSRLERGEQKDLHTEAQLAKLWAASAVPISFFDKDLAESCERKAGYWNNPEGYSKERVASLGIELDSVKKRYMELLLKK
jgi:hypothetical protein